MDTVIGLLVLVLVAALIVIAVRHTRQEMAKLDDALERLTGEWVSVVVQGIGGEMQWQVTVRGAVRAVDKDRLFLDSPTTELPELAAAALLTPVQVDEGIPLERIRSVHGPRDTIHWP
jgi:hypothetical protein